MTSYQTRLDLFPATIQLTSEVTEENPSPTPVVYDKVRVVLTLDHIFVYRDGQPKPELLFEDSLVSYTPPIPATRVRNTAQLLDRSAQFESGDGTKGSFIKMASCGCGSRLKTIPLSTLLPNSGITQMVSTDDINS